MSESCPLCGADKVCALCGICASCHAMNPVVVKELERPIVVEREREKGL